MSRTPYTIDIFRLVKYFNAVSLEAEHHPIAIQERLSAKKRHNYLGDAVLGALDGCVTTFAIVAGAFGGQLSARIALLLGTANLLADGFSMAISNYQKTKSERDLVAKIRRTEERHIEKIPEGEREEIRQVFQQKGFKEPVLGEIVEQITKDRKQWVDTMIVEEYGLALDGPNPLVAGWTTFLAFVLVGAIPLVPLCVPILQDEKMYLISITATALAFFGIGLLKGALVSHKIFWSGLETLLTGGIAAGLAYGVGSFIRLF